MPELPPALAGERIGFDSPCGFLSVYVAGQGPPLLLVHSINAVACAAEMRPLHDYYRNTRTVVSLDLPGFGFSERSDRRYTPRLMTDAIHASIAWIRSRYGDAPIDLLGLSTAAEYVARAAVEAPAHLRSVALVSPTGLRGTRPRRGAPGSTRLMPGVYRVLRGPGWGGSLYRGLTRPGVIRYFLERTWGSKSIDETLWAYDVLTARVPGAEHAPLYFLAGGLFSDDIFAVYENLDLPVWLSHGVRGDFTDYRLKGPLLQRPQWLGQVFATGALPFFELPAEFCAAYDQFLTLRHIHG